MEYKFDENWSAFQQQFLEEPRRKSLESSLFQIFEEFSLRATALEIATKQLIESLEAQIEIPNYVKEEDAKFFRRRLEFFNKKRKELERKYYGKIAVVGENEINIAETLNEVSTMIKTKPDRFLIMRIDKIGAVGRRII